MKTLWTLLKKDLILDFGILFQWKNAFWDSQVRKKLLKLLALLTIGVFYAGFFIVIFLKQFDVFFTAGLADVFLAIGYLGLLFFILMFELAPIISRLYFNNDIKILLRLPLSHRVIFQSKILKLSWDALFFSLFLTFPVVWKYGVNLGMGLGFYLKAVFGVFPLSLITISIMTFVIVFFMAFINRFERAKTVLQFFGMLLLLILSLSLQIVIRKMTDLGSASSIAELTSNVLERMYLGFPYLKLLIKSLTGHGVESILYLIVLFVLATCIFLLVSATGSKWMVRGVLANQVSSFKKRKLNVNKDYRNRSVFFELALREIREIFKVPMYFFNIGIFGILFPVLLLLGPMLNGGMSIDDLSKTGQGFLMLFPNAIDQFSVGMFSGLLIFSFMMAMGQSAVSSISREGKKIWQLQSLPINTEDIIHGKLLSSFFFQVFSVIPTILAAIFFLRLSIFTVAGLLTAIFPVAFFLSNLGLLLDSAFPRLNWEHPQQAVKNTTSTMIMSIASALYLVTLLTSGFKLLQRNWLTLDNYQLWLLVLIAVQTIMGAGIYCFHRKSFGKRLKLFKNNL